MTLESLFNLDVVIFLFINKTLANPVFDFIIFYADRLPYVVYALLIMFSIIKNRNLAVLLIASLVLTGLFVPMIKQSIGRERPQDVLNDARVLVEPGTEKSFPSNHAVQAFLVATLVFSSYRRLGILLFLIAGIVSFGRIYLGVHYLSDIIGGSVVGILIAMLALRASIFMKKKSSHRKT